MKTWVYFQSTGEIYSPEGLYYATGYAGRDDHKNKPESENIKGFGPIPTGVWEIGAAQDHPRLGPLAIKLDRAAIPYGRSSFFIHGDSLTEPGKASHGCIILPRSKRAGIQSSPVRTLVVLAYGLKS